MTSVDPAQARRLWRAAEPYHAVTYFAPEVVEAGKAVGLAGFWMTYFASRAAPMGAVAAPVVTATFYNFAPEMVARAIPDAWARATPEHVLEAVMAGIDRALHRLLDAQATSAELAEAAALARTAADACTTAGRPLAAAWASVDWPTAPTMQLWLALTMLREHRGDGHVTALVAAGLDGCEAHVSLIAAGQSTRAMQQRARGWTDDTWDRAVAGLVDRGWIEAPAAADGPIVATDAGRAGREQIEATTDRLAAAPWQAIGGSGADRLVALLVSLREAIDAAELIPYPNPMGLPGPEPGESRLS